MLNSLQIESKTTMYTSTMPKNIAMLYFESLSLRTIVATCLESKASFARNVLLTFIV